MNVDPAHLVGTGGAIGALLRYAVSQRLAERDFPLDTLTVNVLGTFALGLVTFLQPTDSVALLVGTGACGSFTTFSSFSFSTVRLVETGELRLATANALGNLIGAGIALLAAWGIAQLV